MSFPEMHTFTRNTNNRVGVLLHIQQLDHLLYIIQLLLMRRLRRLPQQRTEIQRLSDRRRRQMQVLLLHVARLPLERRVALAPIHQHPARDDAHRGARGEHIEQRRLACARHAHQRGERAGLDPAVDVVEDAAGFAFDLDVVADVLPVENGGLFLDHGRRVVVGGDPHDGGRVGAGFLVGGLLVLVCGWDMASAEKEHLAL